VSSEVRSGTLYLLVCIEPESLVKGVQEMAYLDEAMRSGRQGTRDAYAGQAAQLASFTATP